MSETANRLFQAAVECDFSGVFKQPDGTWQGHDFVVTVVVERQGLDKHDVVMDFRHLEVALHTSLSPLRGKLLSDMGLKSPWELAHHLMEALRSCVKPPAYLQALILTDGTGRRWSMTTAPHS